MAEGKSFEQHPPLRPEPLDQEWYGRFKKIGSFEAHDYLDGAENYRQEQREKFEAGDVENPTLDYPRLNLSALKKQESDLLEFKRDLLAAKLPDNIDSDQARVIKQAYRWRVNEKIAQVRLLKASAQGDYKRFKKYSDFIYGKPSREVFAYTVNSLRQKIADQLTAENKDIRQAASELAAAFPSTLPDPQFISLPDEESLQLSFKDTEEKLGYLIELPDDGQVEFDASQIQQAFQSALKNLKAEGWQVVINPNKDSISVDQKDQVVNVPKKRRLEPAELKGLILHEIGTHVARREKGERSRLQLLGLGLDRYEHGEEGVATVRQQQASNENFADFADLEGHLSISLARGLDGKPRDFRQVHEIMYKYYILDGLNAGKNQEAAAKNAAEKAWIRCVRTFRGTDCKTPGTAFTKDIVYREGNIAVWEVIRTNPAEMMRFNIGKYDPANQRHLWILTELGISESDLKELAEEEDS